MGQLKRRLTYEPVMPTGFDSDDGPLTYLPAKSEGDHEIADGATLSQSTTPGTSYPVTERSRPSVFGWVVTNWWTLEVLSLASSAIWLTAIVVSLARHQGSPLPRWPLGITINAFVSVLSILIRVSLALPLAGAISQLKWTWFQRGRILYDFQTFDDASRGPLGSLQLLGRTRWYGIWRFYLWV